MWEKRPMGLDVGSATIGVAVSDWLGLTAQGITVIRRTQPQADFAELRRLVAEYEVGLLVIGLPLNMDGSLGAQGQYSQEFARQAQEALGIETLLWDERLTTRSAENFLISANVSRKKRKTVIDKMAAVFILQSYLDSLTGTAC